MSASGESSSSSRATVDQMNAAIRAAIDDQVTQAVTDAAIQSADAAYQPAGVAAAANRLSKPPKIKEPDVFKGNRADLRKFLAQSELYIAFNLINFDTDRKKIMFIASYIRGAAFVWFEHYIVRETKSEYCAARLRI